MICWKTEVPNALGVVVLVGTQGFLVRTRVLSHHCFGGIPLSGAHCLRDPAIDDQSMAVVHEHMPPEARLDGGGIRLAGQMHMRIGCGSVGLVAELDAAEVAFGTLLACVGLTKALAART